MTRSKSSSPSSSKMAKMQGQISSLDEKDLIHAAAIEVDEQDISSKDDGYSTRESILIGKPTKKQQIMVVVCGFLALFQTLGK
jgi:hypothetical protein